MYEGREGESENSVGKERQGAGDFDARTSIQVLLLRRLVESPDLP